MAKAKAVHESPKKERHFSSKTAISLFIGFIMVASTAGYAVMQSAGSSQEVKKNPLDEAYSVNRVLSVSEKVYILQRTGRMLIENLYNESGGELPELTDFASKNVAYVFVEQAMINASDEGGETGLRFIGMNGGIQELDAANLSSDRLFDLVCEFGVRRPVECTLRGM